MAETSQPATNDAPQASSRVYMLDVVRGWSMFLIAGGDALLWSLAACLGDNAFARGLQRQLAHVQWEGFTFYDGIFPTFLLVSGAAFTYSWQKQEAHGISSARRWKRLAIRTAVQVILGLVYNGALSAHSLAEIRFPSVLARIGLGVFLAAIPYTCLPQKRRPIFFPIALLLYAGLFAWCGGDTPYCMTENWAGAIDSFCLPGCIDASGIDGLDPEGIVSTAGAAITAYLGMLLADFLRTGTRFKELWMLAAGLLLLACGYGASEWVPIIKKLWTSSYVCVAGGWTLLFCAFIYQLTDRLNLRRYFYPITFFGVGAIWFYMLPKFFDFRLAAWRILGGLTQTLTDNQTVHGAICTVGSLIILWVAVRLIHGKNRNR